MKATPKYYFAVIPFALFSLVSCNSEPKPQEQKKALVRKPRAVDVHDEHGCLTSSGYLWSDAKDTCIRLWESGAELEPTDRSEMVVYAVVSDDKMKAEIVIPDDTTLLLTGHGNGTYANDSIALTVAGNRYSLKKNGKVIYQAGIAPTEQPAAISVKKKSKKR